MLRDALGVRTSFAAPLDEHADGRALLLAGLALTTLVAASGGFLGLAVRYRREAEGA